MFLPSEMEKLLIVISTLWITVKPALGNHTFVKLKVVAQNRWRVTYWDRYCCRYCEFATIVKLSSSL